MNTTCALFFLLKLHFQPGGIGDEDQLVGGDGMLGVEEDMTWDAYLKDSAIKSLTQVTALSNAAKADNFTFTDEMQQDVDDSLAQIKEYASQNGVSMNTYLKSMFGKNMNLYTL